MARPWNVVEWELDRPSQDEVAESWSHLRWAPTPVASPEVDAYLEQLGPLLTNGGWVIGRWGATRWDDVTSWFVSRNRFDEYQLHRRFLEDAGVQAGLAELHVADHVDELVDHLEEWWPGSIGLDGALGAVLTSAGAHTEWQQPAHVAKDLATRAADALTGRRYDEVRVDATHRGWSRWFGRVIWDHTYVLTDRGRAEITVLCATDRD